MSSLELPVVDEVGSDDLGAESALGPMHATCIIGRLYVADSC
jgi:hypothetical protein